MNLFFVIRENYLFLIKLKNLFEIINRDKKQYECENHHQQQNSAQNVFTTVMSQPNAAAMETESK